MIRRSAFARCAALSMLLSLTGCQLFGDEAEPAVDRSSGPLADEHYVWTAGPGVDLVSGPAVPVRAFVESRLDAQFLKSLDYTYPGFDRAVGAAPADDGTDVFAQNLRPEVSRSSAVDTVRIGNNRFAIQAITRTGNTVVADLCNYRYGLALEQDNGTFVSVVHDAVDDDGIDAMKVRMTAPADDSGDRLPPQEGPAAAPSVDVFGGWKITGFLVSYGGPDADYAHVWPTRDADIARCVAEAPDPPERRAFLTEGEHPRSDFPVAPPTPGWPTKSE